MTTLLLAAAVGILLGAALGMFGGGGGILAVPLLVGLLGMDVDQAATASLVIVLFGALGGLVSHQRAGRVRWRSGLAFGAVSVGGAALGAVLAGRVPDGIKLAAFTVLMLVAGLAMLRNARRQPARDPGGSAGSVRLVASPVGRATGAARAPGAADEPGVAKGVAVDPGAALVDVPAADLPPGAQLPEPAGRPSIPLLVLLATGTGLVTGFLGVGGGFLVVPALVLSLGMPVGNATATGLVVIAIASVSALVVRVGHVEALTEPGLVGLIVVATVGASLAAARLSGRLSPRALGTGFAILVLGMSVLVGAQALAALRAG
jgi:hypothetical protein